MRLLQILQILLFLIYTCKINFAFATETITATGTNTVIGTQTEGTTTQPYITQIIIIPAEANITAGESIPFTTNVIWSDKKARVIKEDYSCSNGIFVGNIWTGTQAGTSVITVTADGQQATATVTVSPAELVRVKMTINEPKIIYGKIYTKDLFNFIGMDKYNNIIPLDKVNYKLRKKTLSHLSEWMGESSITGLNEIIKAGVIFNSHLLFFDVGQYEILVTINEKFQSSFEFKVEFDRFDVKAWEDYRVVDIDFNTGKYIVEYNFPGIPAIQSHFTVKDEWIKLFKEGDIIDKIQVLCWIHYEILEERQKLLKDLEYEQFKNLLLRPLQEKFRQ